MTWSDGDPSVCRQKAREVKDMPMRAMGPKNGAAEALAEGTAAAAAAAATAVTASAAVAEKARQKADESEKQQI